MAKDKEIEAGKPKADCPICKGKGIVECAGIKVAACTCKFK